MSNLVRLWWGAIVNGHMYTLVKSNKPIISPGILCLFSMVVQTSHYGAIVSGLNDGGGGIL